MVTLQKKECLAMWYVFLHFGLLSQSVATGCTCILVSTMMSYTFCLQMCQNQGQAMRTCTPCSNMVPQHSQQNYATDKHNICTCTCTCTWTCTCMYTYRQYTVPIWSQCLRSCFAVRAQILSTCQMNTYNNPQMDM